MTVPYVVTRGLLPHLACGMLSAETLQGAFLWGWLAPGRPEEPPGVTRGAGGGELAPYSPPVMPV